MVSMLLEFAFANHRSYRYWTELSMLASKKQTVRKDTLIPLYRHQYLRAAVIIGPNGSGKSNLVDAFTFMRDFVLGSNRLGPDERIPYVPHSLARSGDVCLLVRKRTQSTSENGHSPHEETDISHIRKRTQPTRKNGHFPHQKTDTIHKKKWTRST